MAKGTDIGVTISLDGERQFKQSLKEIDAGIKVNASSLRLLEAQYGKNGNSTEALTTKGDALEESLLSQGEKVKYLADQLANTAQKYGEADSRTMRLTQQLNDAKVAEIQLSEALEQNRQSLERAATSADGYDHSIGNNKNELSSFGQIAGNVFSGLVDDAEKGKLSLESVWGSVKDGLSQISEDAAKSSGALSSALSGAPVVAAAGLVAAVAKISWEGKQVANEFETSSVKLQNALNLTKEKADEAAKSIKNVYNQGLAESEETAQEVLTNVMKYFDMEGKEAENFSNKILAIGQDSETTIRTARTLAQQFGISYSESLDVIAAGMQNIKAPQGEVLDTLNEYANSFSRLGYDAEGFLSTLSAGMDAGAYSIDKAADSIKEFYNKASSGDTGFSEALKALHMNADNTINTLTAGGDKAQEKFDQIVQKLASVQNETKQAEIASKLFGTQWEDVGTQAILAMGSTKKQLIDYSGVAQKQYENIVNSSENVDKQVGRTMENIGKQALNVGSYLLGPFRSIYDGIEETVKFFTEQTLKAEQESRESGRDMIDGLRVGWQSGEGELNSAVKQSIDDMLKAAQEEAKIHSPSRLFRDKLGEQLAAGVEVGWSEGIKDTFKSIQKSMDSAADLFEYMPTNTKRNGQSYGSAESSANYTNNNTYNFDISNMRTLNQVMTWAQNRRMSQRKGFTNF